MDENQAPVAADSISPQQDQSSAGMLSQDQVNKIVAREKAKAADAARREVESRYQQQQSPDVEALRMQQMQRNAQVSRDSDAVSMDQQFDAMFERKQAELQKRMQDQQLKDHMNQVANNYISKVEAGKKSYEDFDEVMKDHDPTAFPQLTFLLSGMDNAADILYDIARNPTKAAAINLLAERSPRQAQNELLKLSKSISDNKQAQSDAQNQTVPDPLDRLSPTRVASNNGKMSIRDLKSQPWLRG